MSLYSRYFETLLTVGFWGCLLALAHSYLLYPLLAKLVCRWILPRTSRQSAAAKLGGERITLDRADDDTQKPIDLWPAISVLVPAYNEATVIAAKIQNFVALDYPADRMELLIFDDGSSDETIALAEQAILELKAKSADCLSIRVVRGFARRGKATAVNTLGEVAQHDLWLLTDANVVMDRNALKHLATQLIDPSVGAATGPVVLVGSGEAFQQGELLYYQIERSIQRAESFTSSVMGVDGGMYLVRRTLVPNLPGDTILDDFTISMAVMRLGKRIIYCGDAYATECGTVSSQQEYRRRVRIAAGAVQLVGRGWLPRFNQPWLWFQFISHKLIRWTSPMLLLVGSLSAFGLGYLSDTPTHALYGWALACGTIASILAGIVACVPAIQRTAAGSVIHYFVLSQVAMSVGLIKGVFHMQPPQWEKADRTVDGPV